MNEIGFNDNLLKKYSCNVNKPEQNEKETDLKKSKVVYVSKNPDRAVAATGVVAGTSGMIGGAVLGGAVGISKIPSTLVKTFAEHDYGKTLSVSLNAFKNSVANSPEIEKLIQTIKNAKSSVAAEEIINIAGTMSERLHNAFANDPHASAVINKVIDPIISGLDVKHNIRNYGSGLTGQIKSPVGQAVLKLLGFNKKTSKIVKGITGNIAEGFTIAIENIKKFTPEEKEAWKKVAKQMFTETENNPKIKISKDTVNALKGLCSDFKWITEPVQVALQSVSTETKKLTKAIENVPLKTFAKGTFIGAAACGALSLLGWFGLKKTLMKKENTKTTEAQKI